MNVLGFQIPHGLTAAEAALVSTYSTGFSRFCGRLLSAGAVTNTDGTVCSNVTPFRVRVVFDDTEVDTAVTAALNAANEQSVSPGGIVGFRLTFEQMNSCTTT